MKNPICLARLRKDCQKQDNKTTDSNEVLDKEVGKELAMLTTSEHTTVTQYTSTLGSPSTKASSTKSNTSKANFEFDPVNKDLTKPQFCNKVPWPNFAD